MRGSFHGVLDMSLTGGPCGFRGFAVVGGVDFIGQFAALIVAPVRGGFQGNVGVCAEWQQLFPVIEALFETPPFAAGRGDDQKQASGVEHFGGFGPGLGAADGGISQGHEG